MDIREKIIAALEGKWPVAKWEGKNDWDEYLCSNCGAFGYIEDHFCSECGSFMQNYENEKRYHYNCEHCGASLDDAECYSRIEYDAPQVYIYTCPACGKKSKQTLDDASVEIKDDGFDEVFFARLKTTVKKKTEDQDISIRDAACIALGLLTAQNTSPLDQNNNRRRAARVILQAIEGDAKSMKEAMKKNEHEDED